MPVARVGYLVEAWGEGELWLDGARVVWHELPRERADGAAERRRALVGTRARVTPTQGGEPFPPPSPATVARKLRPVSDGSDAFSRHLVHRLQRYFGGERMSFSDVALDLDGCTPFQLDIAQALRNVGYGELISYAELAQLAGHPRAQRATGTFCARNRFPIFLPCHRVVAADGLGSYGSLGRDYKQRLLRLEGVAV